MTFKNPSLLLTLLLVVSGNTSAPAAITWNLTYGDLTAATGVGFNDPTLGASRRGVVDSVLSYVSSVLNENGTVGLNFNASQTDGTGFLASAGSSYFFGGGFQQGLVQQNVLNVAPGNTISPPYSSVTFDFGYNWNSTTNAPSVSEFDLFSVTLHEITHALGFASLISANGMSPIGSTPSFTNTYSTFDKYLQLNSGTQFFNNAAQFIATADTNLNNVADVLESNQVVFVGTNAVAANGGTAVPIYSPTTFAPGSSISHITGANDVMQFSIGNGVQRRSFTNVEIGILKDIGYANAASVTAVPEPGSLLACSVVGLVVLTRTWNRKLLLKSHFAANR